MANQGWDPWVKVETALAPSGAFTTTPGPVPLRVTTIPQPYDAQKGFRLLVVGLVGAVAAGYHGYKRNGSWLRAALWAAAGFTCPVVTLPYAISQGFGRKG